MLGPSYESQVSLFVFDLPLPLLELPFLSLQRALPFGELVGAQGPIGLRLGAFGGGRSLPRRGR